MHPILHQSSGGNGASTRQAGSTSAAYASSRWVAAASTSREDPLAQPCGSFMPAAQQTAGTAAGSQWAAPDRRPLNDISNPAAHLAAADSSGKLVGNQPPQAERMVPPTKKRRLGSSSSISHEAGPAPINGAPAYLPHSFDPQQPGTRDLHGCDHAMQQRPAAEGSAWHAAAAASSHQAVDGSFRAAGKYDCIAAARSRWGNASAKNDGSGPSGDAARLAAASSSGASADGIDCQDLSGGFAGSSCRGTATGALPWKPPTMAPSSKAALSATAAGQRKPGFGPANTLAGDLAKPSSTSSSAAAAAQDLSLPLRFLAATDPPPSRVITVPAAFASVLAYKGVLMDALVEEINLRVAESARHFNAVVGRVLGAAAERPDKLTEGQTKALDAACQKARLPYHARSTLNSFSFRYA